MAQSVAPTPGNLTGIGATAPGGVGHAEARIQAAGAVQPQGGSVARRYRDTSAGWIALPSAHEAIPVPMISQPAQASDSAMLAAHTLRRKYWFLGG